MSGSVGQGVYKNATHARLIGVTRQRCQKRLNTPSQCLAATIGMNHHYFEFTSLSFLSILDAFKSLEVANVRLILRFEGGFSSVVPTADGRDAY